MNNTGYLFTARWPIINDEDYTLRELREAAAEELDALAARNGARITDPATWRYDADTNEIVAEAPAVPRPATWGKVAQHVDRIRTLATERNLTDRQIAVLIGGCSESAVSKVRRRNGIPPGVGNPTLASAA